MTGHQFYIYCAEYCSQALPCVQMKYKEGKVWYNLHDVILWLSHHSNNC